MLKKIIRTVCLFTKEVSDSQIQKLNDIADLLSKNNFLVQTKRICISKYDTRFDDKPTPMWLRSINKKLADQQILLSMGAVSYNQIEDVLPNFLRSKDKYFNLDLTNENITLKHAQLLFNIIKNASHNTFNFTYGFNLPTATPFFPSSKFGKAGFSVGLQSTNLAADCKTLEQWFENTKAVWNEVCNLLKPIDGFLGIDSSVAPMFGGKSSFISFIKNLGFEFSHSVTTDVYTQVSKFIKEQNPMPVGLCGMMFPCLEDFDLADEYENGNFSIERNIFLSLHSGLGIDTYPIGVDEHPERVMQILQLIQQLSNKYKKPLAVRFVSDGKAKIGNKTDFQNQYLKDVVVRKL